MIRGIAAILAIGAAGFLVYIMYEAYIIHFNNINLFK